jgi:cytochrome c-type biogenesis protein CcsB
VAIDPNLAHISDNLMYSAIVVYSGAMFAYCAEWAFGSRSRINRSANADAPATPAAVAADASRPATVAESAGGVALATRPVATDTSGPGGSGGSDDAAPVVGSAGASPRADLIGRMAVSLTVLAFLLHLAAVVARGVAAGRMPWGNMYEFSTTAALALAGVYLVLLTRQNVRWLGVFVVVPVLLTLGLAVLVLYTPDGPLVPALHSYWLAIHVTAAVISSGVFCVTGIAALLLLARERHDARLAAGGSGGRFGDYLERLPSAATLDRTAYRLIAFVFPLWTFAVIAGAIWAQRAWGRYWGWDPKETWAFITWVIYAAYLHARATAGWKGRRAAWIAVLGLAAFLFNFFGVNLLISGMHSYAGI